MADNVRMEIKIVQGEDGERIKNEDGLTLCYVVENGSEKMQFFNIEEVSEEEALGTRKTDEENAEHRDSSDNSKDNRWSKEKTLLLISLYEDAQDKFYNPHIKNTSLWKEIGEQIGFDKEQCSIKFRNLKRQYMTIVDNNKKTGRGSISWPYYERLHTIFAKKPEVVPVSWADSETGWHTAGCSNSKESGEPTSPSSSGRSRECSPSLQKIESPKMKKKKKTEKDDILDTLNRHHEEKIGLQKEFLNLFKEYVNKLK